MIIAKKTYTYEKYFSNDIRFIDSFKLIVYIQSFYKNPKLGFIRKKFYTNIINLNNKDEIFSDFKSNTRNEIRKATKEKNFFETENNIKSFVVFYNDFASVKGINEISIADIKRFGENIVITKAKIDEEVLVMHSYLIDTQIKRVRLLHSATTITNNNRSIVGRSNRFLHFQDMIHFMEKGIEQYDLGGYAFNTKNRSLENINKFKDSFGGSREENMNFYPILFILLSKIKSLLKW